MGLNGYVSKSEGRHLPRKTPAFERSTKLHESNGDTMNVSHGIQENFRLVQKILADHADPALNPRKHSKVSRRAAQLSTKASVMVKTVLQDALRTYSPEQLLQLFQMRADNVFEVLRSYTDPQFHASLLEQLDDHDLAEFALRLSSKPRENFLKYLSDEQRPVIIKRCKCEKKRDDYRGHSTEEMIEHIVDGVRNGSINESCKQRLEQAVSMRNMAKNRRKTADKLSVTEGSLSQRAKLLLTSYDEKKRAEGRRLLARSIACQNEVRRDVKKRRNDRAVAKADARRREASVQRVFEPADADDDIPEQYRLDSDVFGGSESDLVPRSPLIPFEHLPTSLREQVVQAHVSGVASLTTHYSMHIQNMIEGDETAAPI